MGISWQTWGCLGALTLVAAGCTQPATAPGAAAGGATTMGPVSSAPGPLSRLQVPDVSGGLRLPSWAGGSAAPGAAAGQVSDPYAGQGVRKPAFDPPAGAAAPGTAPAGTTATPAAAVPRSHTVAAGETAWSIARKYGVTIQALAAANNLPESMSVRLGQRLIVPPSGGGVVTATVSAPGTGSPTPAPPSSRAPLPREKTTAAANAPPPSQAPDLGKTRTAASGSGRLAMPVSGSIIRAYQKGKNEGIDIAAAPGSSVKAAGSGTVAAITRDVDNVPIVVVRHGGDLLTVYAGLDSLTVSKGDKVTTGQSLGKARSKGSIHFEVRRGFDSVDPEEYL